MVTFADYVLPRLQRRSYDARRVLGPVEKKKEKFAPGMLQRAAENHRAQLRAAFPASRLPREHGPALRPERLVQKPRLGGFAAPVYPFQGNKHNIPAFTTDNHSISCGTI